MLSSKSTKQVKKRTQKFETRIVLKSNNELDRLKEELKYAHRIYVDTETTGVEESSYIVGVSISTCTVHGYYIPLRHTNANLFSPFVEEQFSARKIFEYLKPILEQAENVFAWNWKFDHRMFVKEGINRTKRTIDVMLMAHLIDENELKGLKPRAELELGIEVQEISDISLNKDYNFSHINIDRGAKYAVQDVVLTAILFEKWKDEFVKYPELYKILEVELDIVVPTYKMEQHGLLVDYKRVHELNINLQSKISVVKSKLAAVAGTSFNFDSVKQLVVLLFGEGKITLPNKPKNKDDWIWTKSPKRLFDIFSFNLKPVEITRPKKGNTVPQPATGAGSLEELQLDLMREGKEDTVECQFIENLIEYKKYQKRYTAFIKPLLRDKPTYLKASFLQAGTVSGRYSSKSPNLQQLPRDADEWDIRRCYIARPGKIFYKVDWAAMEMKLAAALSNDKEMIEMVNAEDPHKLNASIFFSKPVANITKEERSLAKTMGFAMLYGAGPAKLAQNLRIAEKIAAAVDSNILLSSFEQLFIKAGVCIDRYFEKYNILCQWFAVLEHQLLANQYLVTYGGRHRHVPKFPSTRELRSAKNTAIQGCVKYDTVIQLKNEKKVTIEDAFNRKLFEKDKIYSIDGYASFIIVYAGRKPVNKLTAEEFVLEATAEHKLKYVNEKGELKVGRLKDLYGRKVKYIKTTAGMREFKVNKGMGNILYDVYDVVILGKSKDPYFFANEILVHNSGADIMKKAFKLIDEQLPKDSRVVAIIHDEFNIETTYESLKEVHEICKKAMEITVNGVTLAVDPSFGYTLSKLDAFPLEKAECPVFRAEHD